MRADKSEQRKQSCPG